SVVIGAQRGGEGLSIVGVSCAVSDGHGADKNFASGEGTYEADAHFPVVTKGFDGRLDDVADAAGEGLAELFGGEGFVNSVVNRVARPVDIPDEARIIEFLNLR